MNKAAIAITIAVVVLFAAALALSPISAKAETRKAGYCCCELTFKNDPNDSSDDYVTYSYIEAVHCIDQPYSAGIHRCVDDVKCGVTE